MKLIDEYFKLVLEHRMFPTRYQVIEKQGIRYKIFDEDTEKLLEVDNFCSNDVLGLAQLPKIKQAAIDAISELGVSNSSCTLYCGRLALHARLEKAISAFKRIPYTHVFLNAWMALQALTDMYCHLGMKAPGYNPKARTLICIDLHSHSCITAAAMNARGGISGQLFPSKNTEVVVRPYKHLDAEDLSSRLKKIARPGDRIMVITDSVFSMEGTIAPLPELIEVLSDYEGALLVCDEAHSSGVIGNRGRGIYDHFGIVPETVHGKGIEPVLLTTFSKFGGSVGAAISSFNKNLVLLLDGARTSSGTASLSPPLAAAALTSIEHTQQNPALVKKLQDNMRYMRSGLKDRGVAITGESAIIAVQIGDNPPRDLAKELLYKHNIWVTPVWYVGKPSLRIMASSLYTKADMDKLITAVSSVL